MAGIPGWLRKKLSMKFRVRFGSVLVFALTVITLCASTAQAADKKYRTLYTFQGGTDGSFPIGVPAVDKDGNLYGTTAKGGLYGGGTIFELTAPKTQDGNWKKTVLYNFTGNDYELDPRFMAFGPDGTLYGFAGANDIFSLTPPKPGKRKWKYRLIYQLNGTTDGATLQGNPVFDAAGNLYGATELEGASYDGTVFELQRPNTKTGQWQIEVLHNFTGEPDGATPYAGLTFDQEGNLWGTTWRGGMYDGGAVYELSPPKGQGQGWTESVVYSFDGTDNIQSPEGPVAFDVSGNLYSTTLTGGDQNCDGGFGCGVVFQLASPNWAYSTLYEFQGNEDGANPAEDYIAFDSQGNLYSTTQYGGGKDAAGIAFKLTPPPDGGFWRETVLHRFVGTDGEGAVTGLTWGNWGGLYGVTLTGGKMQYGTVFEIQP